MEPRQRQIKLPIECPRNQPKSRAGGRRTSNFDSSEVSPLPHAKGHRLAAEAFAESLDARVVEIQNRRRRRRQVLDEFPLRARNLGQGSEELEVDGRYVGHYPDFGP